MIPGIDVARYEPQVNWQKVKAAGYRFAFIKCSQALFNDPLFTTHWPNARAAGIPRGAYHLYDPSVSPEAQADFFYNSLHGELGELPFVVDIEGFTSGKYHGSENWYRFLVRLSLISGNHPIIIYTAYFYWTDHVMDSPHVSDVSFFGRFPLWVADYKVMRPLVPYPWKPNWLFWQYSEEGIVDGVTDQLGRPTECDLDYFFGTEEQFQLLLSSIPPTGGTVTSTFYLATGNATIRTGSNSSFPQVPDGEKYVLTNDIVETDRPFENGWCNIIAIYRGNVKMATHVPSWCTGAYLRPTTYTPPSGETPPPADDVDFKFYRNDILIYHIIGKEQPL